MAHRMHYTSIAALHLGVLRVKTGPVCCKDYCLNPAKQLVGSSSQGMLHKQEWYVHCTHHPLNQQEHNMLVLSPIGCLS